jgi:hypothetical protein
MLFIWSGVILTNSLEDISMAGIPIRRDVADTEAGEEPVTPAPDIRIVGTDHDHVEQQSNATVIATGELYKDLEAVSSDLRNAIRLLSVATERLDEALAATRRRETIAADDALQHFQAMLPELFCLRGLGDGYGMVINALMSAFESTEGTPLSEPQLLAVTRLVKKIHSEPFLNINAAAEAVGALESVGLVAEPRELDILADLLDA